MPGKRQVRNRRQPLACLPFMSGIRIIQEMNQQMTIPEYPDFAPIGISMKPDLHPTLNMLKDGISEFTFANLYLFRHTYDYKLALLPGGGLVVLGCKGGKSFFYSPCCLPDHKIFDELMSRYDYMKNLSETQAEKYRIDLEARGYIVHEDRDNFDYLYHRKDLAELSGRDYHKKRNLVNGFLSSYDCEARPLDYGNVQDAIAVLDEWRAAKGVDGDYKAAREGLELFDVLGMEGSVFYIEGAPVGWCLGESIARGSTFAIHFEKACDRYKGIYQFINQTFAVGLPVTYKFINREQDLGNEGLRQAKMTYRPCSFVRKYRIVHPDKGEFTPCDPAGPAECGPGTMHVA